MLQTDANKGTQHANKGTANKGNTQERSQANYCNALVLVLAALVIQKGKEGQSSARRPTTCDKQYLKQMIGESQTNTKGTNLFHKDSWVVTNRYQRQSPENGTMRDRDKSGKHSVKT